MFGTTALVRTGADILPPMDVPGLLTRCEKPNEPTAIAARSRSRSSIATVCSCAGLLQEGSRD
jgi:hypothetical protein